MRAKVYIERFLMPRGQAGDALHRALASWHECDIFADMELSAAMARGRKIIDAPEEQTAEPSHRLTETPAD